MDNKLILIIASAIIVAMCGFVVWWAQRIAVKGDESTKAITSLELMITAEFAKAIPNTAAHKELRLEVREIETRQIKIVAALELLDPKFIAFFGGD